MSEEFKEQIADYDSIEVADRQRQWTSLSFSVVATTVVSLYVVIPWLLSFFIEQPDVEQKISEGNMMLNLLLSQVPIVAVLLILAFAVQRDLSIRDKFDFKNWNWIYLIQPFGLELIMLPAIWFVTKIFLFVSERFFDTPLEAGHLEAFLMECSDSTLIYMSVGAVIVAPFIEELVFRKIVFCYVKKYSSTVIATIITSLLFAVVHCSLVKIPALVVIAVFLQMLYLRYKSIYPSIILHMVHNGVTFLILVVIRHLMKDDSTRALIEQYL